MIFRDTALPGVIVIEPERREDERGHFARTWCRDAFEKRGLAADFVQCNTSFNRWRGTVRGLHFQAAPHEESKLIRCTRGRVFDVAVDVRAGSATRGQWCAAELSEDNGRMVFIPGGFAHGFATLEDGSEVFYQMSAAYAPEAARGIRWNDPDLAIAWPSDAPILSERDRGHPLFRELDSRLQVLDPSVMPGLDPGISRPVRRDARIKSGHDELLTGDEVRTLV